MVVFEACEFEVVGSSPFFLYVVQFFFFVLRLHINYNISIMYNEHWLMVRCEAQKVEVVSSSPLLSL